MDRFFHAPGRNPNFGKRRKHGHFSKSNFGKNAVP